MEPLTQIGQRGFKYELKSAARTFLAFFIMVLAVQIKNLDVQSVGASLVTGGIAAATRSFFIILIEPLSVSLWSAFVSLLQSISEKLKK